MKIKIFLISFFLFKIANAYYENPNNNSSYNTNNSTQDSKSPNESFVSNAKKKTEEGVKILDKLNYSNKSKQDFFEDVGESPDRNGTNIKSPLKQFIDQ